MSENRALEQALERCQEMITVGSKSFSAAAKLFGRRERAAAVFLYGWCRFCDDQIDEASGQESPERLRQRWEWLRAGTEQALKGEPGTHPVFVAFSHLSREFTLPRHYPLALLDGMAMDIRKETYPDFEALKRYCYRVAGTVGLMMSHLMGISDVRALKHAADLGIAMQLTNIARDVFEDAGMGRLYLPLDWLAEAGIPPERLTSPEFRPQLVAVVSRLLERAEEYYQSGNSGLRYLAFRPACAVAAASGIYAAIGDKVRARGTGAWEERVWISRPRKLWLLVVGMGRVVLTLPRRGMRPWRAVAIDRVWEAA